MLGGATKDESIPPSSITPCIGFCSTSGSGLCARCISLNSIGWLALCALQRASSSSSLNLNSARGDFTRPSMLVDMLVWRGATIVRASRWAWTVLIMGWARESSSTSSLSWPPTFERAGEGSGAGRGTWFVVIGSLTLRSLVPTSRIVFSAGGPRWAAPLGPRLSRLGFLDPECEPGGEGGFLNADVGTSAPPGDKGDTTTGDPDCDSDTGDRAPCDMSIFWA